MTSHVMKILLAGEGSEDAALAARAAVDIARKTGSELHVVHAWHSVPSTRFDSYIRAQLEQEAQQVLAEQVESIKGDGGTSRRPTSGKGQRPTRSWTWQKRSART
jgi:nucleotide-binding universal stress UspA family protein